MVEQPVAIADCQLGFVCQILSDQHADQHEEIRWMTDCSGFSTFILGESDLKSVPKVGFNFSFL